MNIPSSPRGLSLLRPLSTDVTRARARQTPGFAHGQKIHALLSTYIDGDPPFVLRRKAFDRSRARLVSRVLRKNPRTHKNHITRVKRANRRDLLLFVFISFLNRWILSRGIARVCTYDAKIVTRSRRVIACERNVGSTNNICCINTDTHTHTNSRTVLIREYFYFSLFLKKKKMLRLSKYDSRLIFHGTETYHSTYAIQLTPPSSRGGLKKKKTETTPSRDKVNVTRRTIR